ncbi:NRDE protein-domain-containing protein [Lipomyces arxii]|uniref:NRDE protein-domain-containing protein n=1 Tax=Lipomyces arxii TaxID=56418 RepID=UPI0034D01077
MCILLICTSHPKYPLILLSNRDEYLNRSTAPADFWPSPDSDILGPQDLAREEHGTWIGLSRTGRLAVLVNFREPLAEEQISPFSRGILVKKFLQARDIDTADWIEQMIENAGPGGLFSVGGFSMICGSLRPKMNLKTIKPDVPVDTERLMPFAVITNRSTSLVEGTSWLFQSNERSESEDIVARHTIGLSNSLYSEPWPKVFRGCKLLAATVASDIKSTTEHAKFIESLFDTLSTNEMPKSAFDSLDPDLIFDSLRESIFIPVFATSSSAESTPTPPPADEHGANGHSYQFVKGKYYGTRTQTVILVSNYGHVEYIERTLHNRDDLGHLTESKKTVAFEFDIEGWDSRT